MKAIIAYHKEDNDGVFSAAIAKHYCENHGYDVDLMGLTYNDISHIVSDNKFKSFLDTIKKYDVFIMTDISFSDWTYMERLYNELVYKFVWIDHHAPIINISKTKKYEILGVRETDRSAILCMYKYLYDPFDEKYNKGEIHDIYKYLSGWDSFSYAHWNYTLDDVYCFNTGMNYMAGFDVDAAQKIVEKIQNNEDIWVFINTTMEYGTVICENKETEMKTIIQQFGDKSFVVGDESHKACALFMQGLTNSLMFKSVSDEVRHGIVFKRNVDGSYSVSLYNLDNNDDFHCGNFMKEKYNGGGHKGAAGCQITKEQFDKILETKVL